MHAETYQERLKCKTTDLQPGDSCEGRLVEVITSHQLEGTLSVVEGRGQQEESQKTLLRGIGNAKGMWEEIILDLIF